MKTIFAATVRVLVLMAVMAMPALAGPIADFENAFADAYAKYRVALFRTNQSDKAASEAAVAAFRTSWDAITARWAQSPPPHYAEDSAWRVTFARVDEVAARARDEVQRGEVGHAHETLEQIRDLVAELRARNGHISFSDRMNAYHESMEHVLGKAPQAGGSYGLGDIREDAAVLSYLAADLRRHRPAGLENNQAFEEALKAVEASVAALAAATRAGDVNQAKAALQKLKPVYSRLFLNFG